MDRSISSGASHVRYGHYHYPRIIQICCPFCSEPTSLRNLDAPDTVAHFLDIAPFRKIWCLSCSHCLRGEDIDWEAIRGISLLNRLTLSGEEIWAWNAYHFDYLIGLLSGNEDKKHPWKYFGIYIHKRWANKVKKECVLRKMILLRDKNQKLL